MSNNHCCHKSEESYIKGVEDGWEIGVDNFEQYANGRNEWKHDVLAKHFKNPCLRVLCPYHKEKTPSMIFHPIEDKFYCLGCGKEGNGFELAQALSKVN